MSPRLSTPPTVSEAAQHRAKIRPPRRVDRRRHRDDVEVRCRKRGRIAFVSAASAAQIGRLDLAGAVVAGAQFGDAPAVDVEADHRHAGARKRDRDRQADIAEPDHRAEGALVKAGDVLFKIDPAPYAAEVDKANAQLEAAKARVVFTQSELERGAQLVGNAVVTRRDYDQRDNANREAIANVKAAEATLQTAKLNLDYTEVRAPVDGRVGKFEITVGNLVAAGTASPVLTSLVSVNPIYASLRCG